MKLKSETKRTKTKRSLDGNKKCVIQRCMVLPLLLLLWYVSFYIHIRRANFIANDGREKAHRISSTAFAYHNHRKVPFSVSREWVCSAYKIRVFHFFFLSQSVRRKWSVVLWLWVFGVLSLVHNSRKYTNVRSIDQRPLLFSLRLSFVCHEIVVQFKTIARPMSTASRSVLIALKNSCALVALLFLLFVVANCMRSRTENERKKRARSISFRYLFVWIAGCYFS